MCDANINFCQWHHIQEVQASFSVDALCIGTQFPGNMVSASNPDYNYVQTKIQNAKSVNGHECYQN